MLYKQKGAAKPKPEAKRRGRPPKEPEKKRVEQLKEAAPIPVPYEIKARPKPKKSLSDLESDFEEVRTKGGGTMIVPNAVALGLLAIENIDWNVITEMLAVGSTQAECAARYGVSIADLKNACVNATGVPLHVLEDQGAAKFKFQLRSTQIKKALGFMRVERNAKGQITKKIWIPPDTEMLKHLGKQYLDQSEKIDLKALYAGYVFEDEAETPPPYSSYTTEGETVPDGIINGIAVVDIDNEEVNEESEENDSSQDNQTDE